MINRVEVRSQIEFDACIKAGNIAIVIGCCVVARGNSSVVAWGNSSVEARENSSVEAWGNSSVEAWGNSSVVARGNSSVVAWGNSSVEARGNSSVEAWGNSSVEAWGNSSVEARGNSSVEAWGNSSVEAWGNSSVVARGNSSVVARGNSSVVAWGNSSVEAWENSSVEAWGNSSVEAWGNVFIRWFSCLKIKASAQVIIGKIEGAYGNAEGGRQLQFNKPKTAAEWCEFYGVDVTDGVATLFKAVDEDYSTDQARPKDIFYAPGKCPVAPDWDGGKAECGGGLHFSPSPVMALEFNSGVKFIACPVSLSDIAIHPDGQYPHKVKARGCAMPVWEVNRKGEKI